MPSLSDPTRTRLAVLGSPIAHSLSPTLHAAAYQALGVDLTYGRHEVTSGSLGTFLGQCDRDGSWRGLSLTMPLKREVIPFLDQTSPLVDALGVANTLLFRTAGPESGTGTRTTDVVRIGANTDVDGLVRPVQALGHTPDEATIIGGGATAASAVFASARLGVSRVRVFLRDTSKAAHLIELASRIGVALEVSALDTMSDAGAHDLVISTLPGSAAAGLPIRPARADSVLFDVSYDPWPSALGTAWARAGGRVLGGLDMLSEQAVGQVRLFVGGDVERPLPDEPAVRRAMRVAVGLAPDIGPAVIDSSRA